MFVKNRMTKNPLTVQPSTPVDEALALMQQNHVRRLPILEDGKLVGLVTDKDLMRVLPSAATTLAKYEINSLLAQIPISEFMGQRVISVHENAPIEEAALLMARNHISGLPVLSDVGSLVGIITETDIFEAFVDIMGLEEGKTRVTLEVDNKVGVVYDIARIFTESQLNIDSFVTCPKKSGKYEIIIRGGFASDDNICRQLTEHGYTVLQVTRIGSV